MRGATVTSGTDERMRFQIAARDLELIDAHRPSLAQSVRRDAPDTGVSTLDRSVDVLDAVETGARTFTDIVRATGLPRSTAHRLIRALEDHRFLMQIGSYGYALGPRLLSLAEAAARNLPLRELAHPALERLAAVTGESAQLFVRDGGSRVCVDSVQSANELRTIVDIGASLPLTRGSAGKVLLAWAPEADRATQLAMLEPEPRAQLERMLATTRRRGWADSIGEREAGVASVSAPVFDADGILVAAASVSGPANRIGQLRGKRYAPAVAAAAQEIEAALGVARA
jgi:DNA-binding IclR family transcriptional regulator